MKRHILKSITISAVLAALLALNTGCESQLNALPGEKKVYGSIIVDEATAQIALNGVYYRFANTGSSTDEPLTTLWADCHEFYPATAAGLGVSPYGPAYSMEVNTQIAASISLPIWSYCYALVNAANGVIEQIGTVADSKFSGTRKAEIIAEARLLRAYGNFMLLSWYGQFWDTSSEYGVILREEFVTVDNLAHPRSNVADSYASILGDIEYAITNAPDENPNHYVNKWVAKALKARVLIMRGSGSDYADVVSITNDIINNGPYALEENLKDIFLTRGLSSGEVMLGIFPYAGQAGHRKKYIDNYGRAYVTTTPMTEALFADDPRAEWIIGSAYGVRFTIAKYMGDMGEVSYCLRLTEMYLLNAEALLRSGGSVDTARDRIIEVKEKAGVTDFTALEAITDRDQMLRALWDEWALNMSFEDGQEWFALIRFPLSVIQQIKPAVTGENYKILPIPAAEFEKNSAVRGMQNPGWSEN